MHHIYRPNIHIHTLIHKHWLMFKTTKVAVTTDEGRRQWPKSEI